MIPDHLVANATKSFPYYYELPKWLLSGSYQSAELYQM